MVQSDYVLLDLKMFRIESKEGGYADETEEELIKLTQLDEGMFGEVVFMASMELEYRKRNK